MLNYIIKQLKNNKLTHLNPFEFLTGNNKISDEEFTKLLEAIRHSKNLKNIGLSHIQIKSKQLPVITAKIKMLLNAIKDNNSITEIYYFNNDFFYYSKIMPNDFFNEYTKDICIESIPAIADAIFELIEGRDNFHKLGFYIGTLISENQQIISDRVDRLLHAFVQQTNLSCLALCSSLVRGPDLINYKTCIANNIDLLSRINKTVSSLKHINTWGLTFNDISVFNDFFNNLNNLTAFDLNANWLCRLTPDKIDLLCLHLKSTNLDEVSINSLSPEYFDSEQTEKLIKAISDSYITKLNIEFNTNCIYLTGFLTELFTKKSDFESISLTIKIYRPEYNFLEFLKALCCHQQLLNSLSLHLIFIPYEDIIHIPPLNYLNELLNLVHLSKLQNLLLSGIYFSSLNENFSVFNDILFKKLALKKLILQDTNFSSLTDNQFKIFLANLATRNSSLQHISFKQKSYSILKNYNRYSIANILYAASLADHYTHLDFDWKGSRNKKEIDPLEKFNRNPFANTAFINLSLNLYPIYMKLEIEDMILTNNQNWLNAFYFALDRLEIPAVLIHLIIEYISEKTFIQSCQQHNSEEIQKLRNEYEADPQFKPSFGKKMFGFFSKPKLKDESEYQPLIRDSIKP